MSVGRAGGLGGAAGGKAGAQGAPGGADAGSIFDNLVASSSHVAGLLHGASGSDADFAGLSAALRGAGSTATADANDLSDILNLFAAERHDLAPDSASAALAAETCGADLDFSEFLNTDSGDLAVNESELFGGDANSGLSPGGSSSSEDYDASDDNIFDNMFATYTDASVTSLSGHLAAPSTTTTTIHHDASSSSHGNGLAAAPLLAPPLP